MKKLKFFQSGAMVGFAVQKWRKNDHFSFDGLQVSNAQQTLHGYFLLLLQPQWYTALCMCLEGRFHDSE